MTGRTVPWHDPGSATAIAVKRSATRVLTSRSVAALVSTATRGVVRSHGLRIDTRSPEVADATRAALFFRTYESAEIRLSQHLHPAKEVVDLGASLGVLSSAVARKMPTGSMLTCVEANQGVLTLAVSNVRANAPQVSVRPVHGAVDYNLAEGEPVSFARSRLHIATSKSAEPLADGFSAPAIRLSSIAPAGPFTLIMDIEGAEAGVLVADSVPLARCTQMLVELHRTTYDGRDLEVPDLLDLALDHGFTVTASYGNSFVLDRA